MRNSETQRKLLPATISTSEVLSQALIDKKRVLESSEAKNYARIDQQTKLQVIQSKSPNKEGSKPQIERSNTCMKCGNPFTKGYLISIQLEILDVKIVTTKATLRNYLSRRTVIQCYYFK